MTTLRLPREYYLKRAVESFEAAGNPRGAAETLAAFGTPQASAEAARRFLALGDDPAAGEAFLAAGDPRAALACFTRARLPERALACLQALGDDAALGRHLLDHGQPQQAIPHLERALAATPAADLTARAALVLHLARARLAEPDAARALLIDALALLARMPATRASAEAWLALGAWGAAAGRSDRMQEGYAEALRRLAGDEAAWVAAARRYREAAQAIGNRRLVADLDAQLAARVAPEAAPAPPPDPARALLDAGEWARALEQLEPRARSGDEPALRLLATGLVEQPRAPRELRLQAAAALGASDPRLLDPHTGDAPLGGYWCAVEAGPFWFGDDRREELRQVVLPHSFQIGRYPVTNAEYRRFIDAGGYHERRWWTAEGWQQRESNGVGETPRHWDNGKYNQPNQPVVGVTWYEAAAYCIWLTEQGRGRWLPSGAEVRLPTSLEWERAARGVDRRRYSWGDEPPDPERANFAETGIGAPSAVGCFPAGAAACGAHDMAGNVMEWLATPEAEPQTVEPRKDFTPETRVQLSYSEFRDRLENLCCGARVRIIPFFRFSLVSFRLVQSLAPRL